VGGEELAGQLLDHPKPNQFKPQQIQTGRESDERGQEYIHLVDVRILAGEDRRGVVASLSAGND